MGDSEITKTGEWLRGLFRGDHHDFGTLKRRYNAWRDRPRNRFHKWLREKLHMRMATYAEFGWWFWDLAGIVLKNALALMALVIFGVIVWNGGELLSLLVKGPFEALNLLKDQSRTEAESAHLRNLMIGLAAVLSLPFVLIRAVIAERQTRTGEAGRDDQRFVRAVEQLGAEKTVRKIPEGEATTRCEECDEHGNTIKTTVTVAPAQSQEETARNDEVRQGAVALLERIARDSKPDHWPVMEAFCAYLRNNGEADAATLEERDLEQPFDEDQRKKLRAEYIEGLKPPGSVRQAVMNAIGRRPARRVMRDEREASLLPWFPPQQPLPLLKCDLRRAQLFKANLIGANLGWARLEGADLIGARLEGADLSGARLEGANLIGARLEGANLIGARLEGANLSGARLEGAYLIGARLEGADLSGARLEGADLGGARLEGAYLEGARLEGADLGRARLEGACLRWARLEGAYLRWARLKGADLRWARLEGADLIGARLKGADLRWARLEGADLIGARLEGADLGGARLEGAYLEGAEITDVVVKYTSVIGAILSQVRGLTQEQLAKMYGDASTAVPDGFDRPDHWARDGIPQAERYSRWRAWALERGADEDFFPKE